MAAVMRRTTVLIMALMVCYGLAAPASALADGPVDPIATSYVARVSHVPSGVQAKVIDGYLQLWMRVSPTETVVVKDQLGAGWVRFNHNGVYVNHNSLLFYESQIPVEAIAPKRINATTPPDWVKVSSGHTWMWREGRLQAFAHQTLVPGQTYAGPWSIAMTVDGRATKVAGGLYFQPRPSIVWFWPVLVILLCAIAAFRLRSNRLDRRLVVALTELLLAALLLVSLARLLHGRPTVSAVQIAEFAVAAAAILAGAVAFARGRWPAAIPFLVAFIALWAGLTFLPVLTHQYALLILPGWLTRAATALLLGGGVSLVLMAMRRPLTRPPTE
jgi:hypothetical protein